MAIREVVIYPDKRLKIKCKPVEKVDDSIRQLIKDMFDTMYEYRGIGLAATQIAVQQRVVVIDLDCGGENSKQLVFINPEIIESSGSIRWEEGCLSVPSITAEMERSAKVKVKALDTDGNLFELEAEELLAVCLQHEIDHLNGIVFPDKLSRLKRELIIRRLKKQNAAKPVPEDQEPSLRV